MHAYRYPSTTIALFPGLELSADQPTPLAFSQAALFRKSTYCLYAEVRTSKKHGDYVLYTIGKLDAKTARYDVGSPIYQSTSYEDVSDVWRIFR